MDANIKLVVTEVWSWKHDCLG